MELQEVVGLSVQIILIGGGIWVAKAVILEWIKRYFRMQDIKAQEFKHVNTQLSKILIDIELIIQRLVSHSEVDEEYRAQVEEKFLQQNSLIKKEVSYLKEKDAEIDAINKERYSEIKGKMSKMWSSVAETKENLNNLITEHKIHHKK